MSQRTITALILLEPQGDVILQCLEHSIRVRGEDLEDAKRKLHLDLTSRSWGDGSKGNEPLSGIPHADKKFFELCLEDGVVQDGPELPVWMPPDFKYRFYLNVRYLRMPEGVFA